MSSNRNASYATAYDRWAGVGPYYAMFPLEFVDQVIGAYSKPGDRILDPFAGRASTVFAGARTGRLSLGIEINPVGWIYGKTKLDPASSGRITKRLQEVCEATRASYQGLGNSLPEFYHWCFSRESTRFLLTARDMLDWRTSKIDRTLMAIILIDLHGVRGRSFSNQMRQGRAMFPDYSVQWWKSRNMVPPEIDPETFIKNKIGWRYAKGTPDLNNGDVWLGDSTDLLNRASSWQQSKKRKSFKLLITSPPYMGVSDYHRDQWLRLWMLGGPELPARLPDSNRGDFDSESAFREMLSSVFSQSAEMMSRSGYVYVRTDARQRTFEITRNALREAFPNWVETIIKRPYTKRTQTALYGDKSSKPGEIDIILKGPSTAS